MWDSTHQTALEALKKAVSSAPVLRYYNLEEEVFLQCDASQSGLRVALLQGGQPVAYASRALRPAETHYTQIEKELLAIVFGCDYFEAYVYGRDIVHVETDHKLLESIMLKPLNSAPKHLRRMLLHLQKYNLEVKYKSGDKLYLADTLSRAHRAEIHVCDLSHNLVEVDHTLSLPLKESNKQQIRQASLSDPTFITLQEVIEKGWPISKQETGISWKYTGIF